MNVIDIPRVSFETPIDYQHEILARTDRVRWLIVPERRYLMIDGSGAPGGSRFQDSVASLYPVAYGLHFALRRRGVQAPVGALEGLFWRDGPGPSRIDERAGSQTERNAWRWRLLLPIPQAAADAEIEAALEDVRIRKDPPRIDSIVSASWDEGQAAQIMHIGPYADEPRTIDVLHRAIAGAGFRPDGCRHEIYISDPGRTRPAQLKTIIRQPVTS